MVDLQDLQNIPAEIQSEKDEEKRLPEIDRMGEKGTLVEECWRGTLVAEDQMGQVLLGKPSHGSLLIVKGRTIEIGRN